MATIDELKVKITADSQELVTGLTKGLNTAKSIVSQLGGTSVDWNNIFTQGLNLANLTELSLTLGTVFTAAIGAAVGMALDAAVSSAAQFQAMLVPAGVAAGLTPSQISQTGQAALTTSGTTGQNPSDIVATTDALSTFLSTGDASAVSQQIAELAPTFGSMSDITTAAIPIMKEFGVTTQSQAVAVLTDLMHAAQATDQPISKIADGFSAFIPQLINGGAGLSSFNGLLSSYAGIVQSSGFDVANNTFSDITGSIKNATGPLELMGNLTGTIGLNLGNVNQAVASGDLSTLLPAIAKGFTALSNQTGGNLNLIAGALGISATNAGSLAVYTNNWPKTATHAAAVAKNTESISKSFADSDTEVRNLTEDWDTFKAQLTNAGTIFLPVAEALTKMVASWVFGNVFGGLTSSIAKSLNDGMNNAADFMRSTYLPTINKLFGPLGQTLADALKSGLDGDIFSGFSTKLAAAVKTGLSDFGKDVTAAENSVSTTYNTTINAASSDAKSVITQLYNAYLGIK